MQSKCGKEKWRKRVATKTLATRKSTPSPHSCAWEITSSELSTPMTSFTCFVNPRVMDPGPQPTSSSLKWGWSIGSKKAALSSTVLALWMLTTLLWCPWVYFSMSRPKLQLALNHSCNRYSSLQTHDFDCYVDSLDRNGVFDLKMIWAFYLDKLRT